MYAATGDSVPWKATKHKKTTEHEAKKQQHDNNKLRIERDSNHKLFATGPILRVSENHFYPKNYFTHTSVHSTRNSVFNKTDR